jgi:hypothetical protein
VKAGTGKLQLKKLEAAIEEQRRREESYIRDKVSKVNEETLQQLCELVGEAALTERRLLLYFCEAVDWFRQHGDGYMDGGVSMRRTRKQWQRARGAGERFLELLDPIWEFIVELPATKGLRPALEGFLEVAARLESGWEEVERQDRFEASFEGRSDCRFRPTRIYRVVQGRGRPKGGGVRELARRLLEAFHVAEVKSSATRKGKYELTLKLALKEVGHDLGEERIHKLARQTASARRKRVQEEERRFRRHLESLAADQADQARLQAELEVADERPYRAGSKNKRSR